MSSDNSQDFKATDPNVVLKKDEVDYAPSDQGMESFKYYPDTPTSALHKYRFSNKEPTRYYDPCQESSKMSFRCLEVNDYDKEKCYEVFKAYRECKKEWLKSRRENRASGDGW